jgi:alcohol dehydrogenase, propanol-preferring
MIGLDTGESKKKLCLDLGAEKWVDFRESKDFIKDVQAATDGLGPEAAVIAAGDVRSIFIASSFYFCFKNIYSTFTDNAV